MVVSVGAKGVWLAATVASVLGGSACGGKSSRTAGSSGMLGAQGGAGAAVGTGGGAGTLEAKPPVVVQGPDPLELDGSDCETRRAGDCRGFDAQGGQDAFEEIPELAQCEEFDSRDGCGKLIYAFDAQGCATSVGPGAGGWKESGHLAPLRDCLSAAFADARFSCLASGTFAYYETCYLR